MFKFFGDCVFCNAQLPQGVSGDGEHVIPKNIFGFWRSYDVCDSCREYFGASIDGLALRNAHIIKAMQDLNLPDTERLDEHLHYHGVDSIDGRKVGMIKKNGIYRIKANLSNDNFAEFPEDLWEQIGIAWIRDRCPSDISEEDCQKEINRRKNEYAAIEPGKVISSKLLGFAIKKRQVEKVSLDQSLLEPITPLIAKIDICFLRYIIPPVQVNNIVHYELLKNHARFNGPLSEYTIIFNLARPEATYHKFHKIGFESSSSMIILNVALFGYLRWTTVLRCSAPIELNNQDTNLIYCHRSDQNQPLAVTSKPASVWVDNHPSLVDLQARSFSL